MFVRMRICSWKNFEISYNGLKPTPISLNSEISIGFLPVYNTLDDLLEDYPGETNYVEIQEVESENKNNIQ